MSLVKKLSGAGGNKAITSVLTLVPSSGLTINWDGSSPLILNTAQTYTVTANQNINLSVKMWGAGGACGYNYTGNISSTSAQGPGGGGGYTTGIIAFTSGQTYIFRVGQGGIRSNTGSGLGATYLAGGLPTSITIANGGAQGGGYSGIFATTTVSQANALLIAGGGGGGSDTSFSAFGGAGGGTSGQNSGNATPLAQGGTGGSQSAGGSPSSFNGATAGSALTGGFGATGDNGASLGGGGGGYFGGGGGNVGGGGGGSGYFKPSSPVSSASTTVGSTSTPANSADPDRGTAGQGGIGGATSGSNGAIVLWDSLRGSTRFISASNQYLSTNVNASDISGKTFTIEAFFYLRGYSKVYGGSQYRSALMGSSSSGGWELILLGTASSYTGILLYTQSGISLVAYNTSFNLNTWYHVAITKNQSTNTYRIYLNGSLVATNVNTSSFTLGTSFDIGRMPYPSYEAYLDGNLSQVRIVFGSEIVPPAGGPKAPLTAVSGTALLTAQGNNFVDRSPNAYTVTSVGATNSSLGPF